MGLGPKLLGPASDPPGMPPAWIQLQCPDCESVWEENPGDLPEPDREFTCDHCGSEARTSEFMKTKRSLEVLEEFAD